MTAQEYLQQARSIRTRLQVMAEQLAFLKAAAEYVVPQFSDMPKSASRNVHKSEDAILRVLAFEERIRAQVDKLAEINDTVDRLQDPLQRMVLVKHYLSGKTWREVAIETHYCERTIRSIHTAALVEIERLIKSLP